MNSPNIGNLLYRKDNLTNQYENFTYDNLDRLTGITYKTDPVQTIAYSNNGNISSKYNGGTYAYGIKPHAVTSVTKTAGTSPQNMQEITYTTFNKAASITQRTPGTNLPLYYTVTYGPDEQRVRSWYKDTLGLMTTLYYAGLYEKEIATSVTKQIHYINAGNGLAAVYIKWPNTGKDTLYYVCKDRQGSITALLRQNGTVAEKYSYDAWGRRRNPANWADYNVKATKLINRGYTSHEMLDAFGLINMNGRMYDPVIGRILSPDNFVQAPAYTQSYNRYSYCFNNPMRYTDPSGWYTALYNPGFSNETWNVILDGWNRAGGFEGTGSFTYSFEGGNFTGGYTIGAGEGAPPGYVWQQTSKRLTHPIGDYKWSDGNGNMYKKEFFYWEMIPNAGWDSFEENNFNPNKGVTFDQLWNNYPTSSILHIDPKTGKDIFSDHCAINLSEAMMRSGVDMSSFGGVRCWGKCPSGGGHIVRAQQLADGLNGIYKVTPLAGSNWEGYTSGKQGIIFFQDYFKRQAENGRTGDHIDLWNGSSLRSNGFLTTWFRTSFPGTAEFFGLSDLRRAPLVWFWELK